MENITDSTAVTEAHVSKIYELLPVITTMGILGFVGIIGNVVTVRFYLLKRRRTPTVYLIISLAIVDLIVCVLFAPNIAEMIVNVKYTSNVTCKLMHFLGHWFVESSGLILGFIALDRYWTICGRFRRKVNSNAAKRVVIGIIGFSCIMSVRDFFNFDVITVNVNTGHNATSLTGHYCSNSRDPSLHWSVLIFHGIDTVTFLAILVLLVVTYSNVIWTLFKVKRIAKENVKLNTFRPLNTSKDDLKSVPNLAPANSSSKAPEQQSDVIIEDDYETGRSIAENQSTPAKKRLPGQRKLRRSELSVTMLMLAVSAAFFVCAAPYFAIRFSLRSLHRDSDLEFGLMLQFGLRLGYINSVLNPLIYCLFLCTRFSLRSLHRDSDLELGLMVQFGLRLGYINSVLNPLIYCLFLCTRFSLRSLHRDSDLELGLMVQFGLRLGYINSVLNPLIYCLFNPSFRRHLKRALLCSSDGDAADEPFSTTFKSIDR